MLQVLCLALGLGLAVPSECEGLVGMSHRQSCLKQTAASSESLFHSSYFKAWHHGRAMQCSQIIVLHYVAGSLLEPLQHNT
jgi:hypothetical protein